MLEVVSSRFNVSVRPLKNGDMIKIEAEIPFTDEGWTKIAPLALKRVKVMLDVATQVDIDEADGQSQLDLDEDEDGEYVEE